jgi:hypothetical protein
MAADSVAGLHQSRRASFQRPVIAVPVLADGKPAPGQRMNGMTTELSLEAITLEFDVLNWQMVPELALGVQAPDGTIQFAGVRVWHKHMRAPTRVQVECKFGGIVHDVFKADSLAPRFVPESMSFVAPFPDDLLEAWAAVGALQSGLIDRVQVCPRCHALPTFRPGCRQCGSADVGNDQLMHHFACAHVAKVSDFEVSGDLVCPKCRTRHLIVSSDYEYLTGPYRCRQCQWSDMELEQIAHCLRCAFRCPGHQAHLQDLRGYRAHRLEPLALLPPS